MNVSLAGRQARTAGLMESMIQCLARQKLHPQKNPTPPRLLAPITASCLVNG